MVTQEWIRFAFELTVGMKVLTDCGWMIVIALMDIDKDVIQVKLQNIGWIALPNHQEVRTNK